MSDVLTRVDEARAPSSLAMRAGTAAAAVLLMVAPLYFDVFWLQMGLAISGAAVGAIGLNLLVGTTGQLSFAHPFFVAIGAVGYVWMSGSSEDGSGLTGLGLPPTVAALAALAAASLIGMLISPIASRLKGIYLGVATIAFIFIGQHILDNWTSASGGYNGRLTTELSILGFSFGDTDPDLVVLGVPFGRDERLWYLGVLALCLAVVTSRRLVRGRVGRALTAVRDSEVLAAMNGIDVRRAKRDAFALSAAYAGAAGVIFAFSVGSVAPESFDIFMAINYLAMIVIGGLGSVWGSVLGAAFVTALPLLLQKYAAGLPLVVATGESGGVDAAGAARYLFGAAIVLVMLFEPQGLAGLGRRLRRRFSTR